MKFNIKVIVFGGLAMYVAQWIVSMVTGSLIHEGVLNGGLPDCWQTVARIN